MSQQKEYRCVCGKLLFKGEAFSGALEIKCKRCGRIQVVDGLPAHHEDAEQQGADPP